MDKKGEYDFGRKALYMIVVLFVLALIFGILYASFGRFSLDVLKDTKDVAGKVLIQQMVYSPLCFSYIDKDTNRSYPGVIDIDKFKNETLLSKCGKYFKNRFGVYLIKDGILHLESQKPIEITVLKSYLLTVKKENILKIGKTSEHYTRYYQRPVIIKSGTQESRGILIVGMES